MPKPYTSRLGEALFKPEIGVDIDDSVGWCLACGTTQDGVEPDAAKYRCPDCGKPKVYGLAELALLGLVV